MYYHAREEPRCGEPPVHKPQPHRPDPGETILVEFLFRILSHKRNHRAELVTSTIRR